MKCPICNSRKGKRACPALGKDICTQCCGEKRVTEIPCPSDCSYLRPGLENEWIRTFSGFGEWVGDPGKTRHYLDTFQQLFGFIRTVEMEIVRHTRRFPAFTDAEVLDAVGLALEDYRTEERGILYEHSSTNPAAQRLLRHLVERIGDVRKALAEDMSSFPLVAVTESLEFIHAQIRYLMSGADGNQRAYLDFLSRQIPPSYLKEDEPNQDEPGKIVLAR